MKTQSLGEQWRVVYGKIPIYSVTTLDKTPAGTISATDKTPINPSTTNKTITIDNIVILYQKELKNAMSMDQQINL